MTPTELQQFLRDKLRKAYSLGQTWWQQADSEYRRENKKADETAAKFAELVENVVLAVTFELNRAGATEAAKATGTAGELPPLPESQADGDSTCDFHGRLFAYTSDDMREYGQACAEAARQPAPVVAVKTWQERTGNHNIRPGSVKHMLAEIADLRAALAANNTAMEKK